MALFTRRDRISIACIILIILFGWGIRYAIHRSEKPNEIKIIRNAVTPPAILESSGNSHTLLIDINTADEKELESLPMIGPVKAAAITAYRQKQGPFTRISDIMNVHGIGPATYEKIKNHITVKPKDTSTKQELKNDR